MTNPLEIIVGIEGESPTPIRFEKLKSISDKIESIMFLWNSNSYYLNVKHRWFMINGGRQVSFRNKGEAKLIYRKRTSQNVVMSGDSRSLREVSWIFGLYFIDSAEVIMLKISEHGNNWEWINTL